MIIKSLSKEQSFSSMETRFKKLRVDDVIDLGFQKNRVPSIVHAVDYDKRLISVILLTTENIAKLKSNTYSEDMITTLKFPSNCDEELVFWNVMQRQ
jgi:hypothetical protein